MRKINALATGACLLPTSSPPFIAQLTWRGLEIGNVQPCNELLDRSGCTSRTSMPSSTLRRGPGSLISQGDFLWVRRQIVYAIALTSSNGEFNRRWPGQHA